MRLLRIANLVVFTAMAGFSLSLVVVNFGQSSVRNLASDLFYRRNVSALQVHQGARATGIETAVRTCRSDLLNEALSVTLADLNQTNQVADYNTWADTHARSQVFLRGMIRCLPMNANAWLREAMVSRAIAEDADSLRARLQLARQLAPFERQMILGRLSIWQRLSPLALDANRGLAEADILSVLRYGRDPMIKALAAPSSVAFGDMVAAQLPSLDADRRAVITPLLGP